MLPCEGEVESAEKTFDDEGSDATEMLTILSKYSEKSYIS